MLTTTQRNHYVEHGYVVVENLLGDDEIAAFAAGAPPTGYGLHGHLSADHYRMLAVHPKVAGGAQELIGGPARIVQTMLLDKPAAGGKGIALHQDSHYLPNEPNTLMACWLALTDTDPGNGGLCVVPGSHRGELRRASRTRNEKDHLSWSTDHEMSAPDGRRWSETLVSFEIEDLDPAQIVRLTVPRGAGVFFSGMLIHGSFANESSDRPRTAFAIHYVRQDTWLYRCDIQDAVAVETLRREEITR